MRFKFRAPIGAISLVTLFALFIAGYLVQKKKTRLKLPVVYQKYISAYTGNEVSRNSSIIVRFVDEMVKPASLYINYSYSDNPFKFTPSIYGHANWIDTRTIEFHPEEKLNSGEVYDVTLDLGHIITTIPDSFKEFHFKFKTIKQAFKVEVSNPEPINSAAPQWQKIHGIIKMADVESHYTVRDLVSAYKGGASLNINWETNSDSKEFKFTIDSLLRNNDPYDVTIKWGNGDKKFSGTKVITMPALGSFVLLNAKATSYPSQFITLEFSDPLKAGQLLDGLVRTGNINSKLQTEGNKIYIYPEQRIMGSIEVVTEAGIENTTGLKLQNRISSGVSFEEIYPQLKAVGKGTIIPQSDILPFTFEAVNLSAVDVRIIKITEKNIPQFLQVNRLDEARELKRVGTILLDKKITLNSKKQDLKQWNKHVIDLSKLIQTEPGAIYQVAIGFRKSYSLLSCNDTTGGDAISMLKKENWDEPGYDSEYSYWDYNEEYHEEYYDKDDPCKKSYYNIEKAIVRNVLASNIGLIAKQETEGGMQVVATDLLTTSPLSNADIEVYDYQQQLIGAGKTQNGLVKINPKRKPFLVIAKHGRQRGYLKVDNSSSLSLSRFDVGGKEYHKGLKGFIYGERDVWRPGDSLFLSFILEDKLKALPIGHPVIFEMYNPRQELAQRIVKKCTADNFYSFRTITDHDAPTGNYSVKVIAGGVTFEKTVKVETIIPNRLKIKLDWDSKEIKGSKGELNGVVSARWLHGALAKNLETNVSVAISEGTTSFKAYTDYTFTDDTKTFAPERKEIYNGMLNDQGTAQIKTNLSVEGSPCGILKASFKTRVFEPGGNFSSDYFTIPFYPYDTYVGIKINKGDKARNMLPTDKDHAVKIVSLNAEGKPVAGKKVSIELYKISWKWWWDTSENEDYSYNGQDYSYHIKTDTITTNNIGEAIWKLRINYPEWGRYRIKITEEGGHSASHIFYIDWPGWAGRAQQGNPEGAKMLTFSGDKEVYTVGETITLNIPTGYSGRALLSLESGTKVINSYWVTAQKGITKFSFPATADMAPNVYAHITLLQPHAQTKNDLPIRIYGILPIKVEDPASHLHPVITMKDELQPEDDFTLRVQESEGKAMTYTIAIVDEGLLDLTRYQLPDVWSNFNERQALNVKTWDMFDDVAGAESRTKNLLSIGGDGNNGPMDGAKANRFKPVVLFAGPFHVCAGQSKIHRFKMPNYIGSVKTMVVAAHNGAYGNAEKATPVKKSLMVLGTLPRVLGPGEELSLPLTLFAMEKNIKNVSVKIENNELITVVGPSGLEVQYTQPGEEQLSFNLKANKEIGVAKIKVTAKAGKEIAIYETEIEVRNSNPIVESLYEAKLEKGRQWQQTLQPNGIKGTNNLLLEVSNIAPLNLGKRLEYLIHYPYGCIEQTTSGVFPQLCLSGLLNLSKERKDEVDRNIRAGIARLKLFQKTDGSLTYWPGDDDTNEWGTCYAGHFMLEAELWGYFLPHNFKDKWKEYVKTTARNYQDGDELTQAYRLYLLALCKSPELGAMNRMKLIKQRSEASLWYLAAAYHLAGQPEIAKEMVASASLTVKKYKELDNTFGSDERDKAIILRTLTIMNEPFRAAALAQDLSASLNGKEYMNTQATAYALVALANYSKKFSTDTDLKFAYRINGKKWKEVSVKNPLWQQKLKNDSTSLLEIKNIGDGLLFTKAIAQGIPEQGDISDASYNLTIEVSYKTMDGKPFNPVSIPQGTDFMAQVTLTNPGVRGNYMQLSLTEIFPSGWEINNTRLTNEGSNLNSPAEYTDFRDDRVNIFFNLAAKEKKTFTVLLNASYQGKFYQPSVYSEAMYDNSISAHKHGQWVRVTKNNSLQ